MFLIFRYRYCFFGLVNHLLVWTTPLVLKNSDQSDKGRYLFSFDEENCDRSLSLNPFDRERGNNKGSSTRETEEKKEAKEVRNRENLELKLRRLLERLSRGLGG